MIMSFIIVLTEVFGLDMDTLASRPEITSIMHSCRELLKKTSSGSMILLTTKVKVDGPVRPRNWPVIGPSRPLNISTFHGLKTHNDPIIFYGPVITGSYNEPVTGTL